MVFSCPFLSHSILLSLVLTLIVISLPINGRQVSLKEKKQSTVAPTPPSFNPPTPAPTTTKSPTTPSPTTSKPTPAPTPSPTTTKSPTTPSPTTSKPTPAPTPAPTTTKSPTTPSPTTSKPTPAPTPSPTTTKSPTTPSPTTSKPTPAPTPSPTKSSGIDVAPTPAPTASPSILAQIQTYITNCSFDRIVDNLPDNISNIDWTSAEIHRSLANLIVQLGELKPNTSCKPLRVWVDVISLAYYELDCNKANNYVFCQVVQLSEFNRPTNITSLPSCTKYFCAQNPGDTCQTNKRLGICNSTSVSCPVSCVRLAGVDEASLEKAMERYAYELSMLEESFVRPEDDTKRDQMTKQLRELSDSSSSKDQTDDEAEETEDAAEKTEDVFLKGRRVAKRSIINADNEEEDEDKRDYEMEAADYCYDGAPSCGQCSVLGISGLACFDVDRYTGNGNVCCRCLVGFGGNLY
eukprot:TRINITY_DN608_c0_g1_i1.p1 TRINITY_DN608_c0_g1~~TRINITY_DN608_c0_g1_i1.p1  ORF type:complete len:463 (+),score=110.42 TRINITY_DN608_c0_g1_i1:62-1450(+)